VQSDDLAIALQRPRAAAKSSAQIIMSAPDTEFKENPAAF
jgi:DICT domain-containing protein